MANVFKCLRPKIITNKVGERVTISCGYCKACLSKKASYRAKLCVLEQQNNNYTYFFTLTYAQENLPVANLEKYGDNYYLVNATPRLRGALENDCVAYIDNSYGLKDIDYIFDKVYDPCALTPYGYGEGSIPYLSKVDIQRFLKRLRYYIKDYCNQNELNNETVRYYIGAEYGPDHFRPHFHVLLFFQSSWLKTELPRILREAWTFGNIDFSQVQNRSGSSSYVASYVNCFSYLPAIYKTKGLRPFSLHSVRFGQADFRPQFEEVLRCEPRGSISLGVQFGDKVREVFAPVSLSTTLLPRCFHHVLSNDYMRYRLLSLFARVVAKWAVKDPTRALVCSIVKYVDPDIKIELEKDFGASLTDENIDSIVSSSYNYYRLSQEYPCLNLRKRIGDYYNFVYAKKMKDFYLSQRDFVNKYGSSSREFLVHYYDNVYVKGMDLCDMHSLSPADIERSKRFYDSINIAWDFIDVSDIEYQKNPCYLDAQRSAELCFDTKSKAKKYNDKFKSKVLSY